MDTLTRITEEQLRDVAARTGFDQVIISKDYYVTVLLYLLKEIKGLYFKGGTALQKIFLEHSRLSEDIDFTVTRDINVVKEEIENVVEKSKLFDRITKDKHVHKFVRLIIHYTDPFGVKGTVFIDLNERVQLFKNPEKHEIRHFYGINIPLFFLNTLSRDELVAEKMAAAIGRNKPRDHFDLYQILKHGFPINLGLVKQKRKKESR